MRISTVSAIPAITPDTIIADLVLARPETARIFAAYEIDFCWCAGQSIREACAGRRDLDANRLIAELERAASERLSEPPPRDPNTLSTPALIARIMVEHHGYLRATVPEVERLMRRVVRVHGESDPGVLETERAFDALAAILFEHQEHEEKVLFPALMSPDWRAEEEMVRREFAVMCENHRRIAEALEGLRALADGYTVPYWACPTYRVLYVRLEEMDSEVRRHADVEDNVLMARFGVRAAGGSGAAAPGAR